MLNRYTRRWIYNSSAIVTAMMFLLLTTILESRPTKLLSQTLEKLQDRYHNKLEPRGNPDPMAVP
jgi:hypothetical protein